MNHSEVKYWGGIPIRNLWFLILYASDLYKQIGKKSVLIEESPDEIFDLVSEFLCGEVEIRLKRYLSLGYKKKTANLNRIRGKIDVLNTERHYLLEKGQIRCQFDELTIDTDRNRYVLKALKTSSNLVLNKHLAHRCRNLALQMLRMGVSKDFPQGYSPLNDRLGRHNLNDKPMLSAAKLVFDLALPTVFEGQNSFAIPDKKIFWLRKLFEKGIAGLYTFHFKNSDWSVLSGKYYKWNIGGKSQNIDDILPIMKTDIVLENFQKNLRIVIDTKFNSLTQKGWYRDETIRSGYIYQMYTYLRSQELDLDILSFNSEGLFIHPTIDKEIDEFVEIQGHKIRFCTINMCKKPIEIKQSLCKLIECE